MTKFTDNRLLLNPRARIRVQDSRLYTYPTNVRTGDKDRKGDFAVRFDDMVTVDFVSRSNVHYPTGLISKDDAYFSTNFTGKATDGGTGEGDIFHAGGLIASGTVRKGVADSYLADIPDNRLLGRTVINPSDGSVQFLKGFEEPLSPFVEDGLYALESSSRDDQFWSTGSRHEDVGLGFQQPLWSKTKLEIDLSPAQDTTFGFTREPSLTDRRVDFTPIVYYNFVDKVWDPIGTGANVTYKPGEVSGDHLGLMGNWREQTVMGFARGTELSVTGVNQACSPVSTFGFPVHPKYHATASQLLDMGDLIAHPFLLEKYVLECELSYSLGDTGSYDPITTVAGEGVDAAVDFHSLLRFRASINTFFILNQRSPFSASVQHVDIFNGIDSGNNQPTLLTSSIPSTLVISKGAAPIRVDTGRDLVTWGQITSVMDDETAETTVLTLDQLLSDGLSREVTIDLRDEKSPVAGGQQSDSSFSRRRIIMSGTVKQATRLDTTFGWSVSNPDRGLSSGFFGFFSGSNVPGGRTGIVMKQTGREINAAQPGAALVQGISIRDDTQRGTPPGGDVANSSGFLQSAGFRTVASPYLLLPEDKLVLGWQVAVPYHVSDVVSGGINAAEPQGYFKAAQLTIHAVPSRLTLYGSLVREEQEFHDTINQPLASNAIHEVIHFDNPVLDQFDTEPVSSLSGSHIDGIFSGSMTSQSPDKTRGRIGSHVGSGPVFDADDLRFSLRLTPGSERQGFLRGYQCISEGERYFDSMMPKVGEITVKDGAAVVLQSNGSGSIFLNRDAFNTIYNNTWKRSFPFEPRYSGLSRFIEPLGSNLATVNQVFAPVLQIVPITTLLIRHEAIEMILDDFLFDGTKINPFPSDVIKHFFGFGDLSSIESDGGSGGLRMTQNRFISGSTGNGYGAVIRGWKYGMKNGSEEFSKVVYRRNRFGQFRDMLEQRPDTRYFDTMGLLADGVTRRDPGVRSAAVKIRFINPDGQQVEGNRTFSSNLSKLATSSLPYFDGKVRNREEPLDMTLIDSVLFEV